MVNTLFYSGWLDEHDHDMQFWPPNFLTDITQFLLAHGDVALTNDMLKDYKVGKAYEYFSSGCRHDREFKKPHKFHTLQCKNNKLLLSNHHLLWRNIYTLWGSSSSVCDCEHFVLKIHKLLLFDLAH
jgi:hypothetical protein